MEPPPVQYVTTSEGVRIAYSVSGAGRPLVVCGPAMGGMAHLWRFVPEWMEGLSARFRVVQHDMHGHGMSERGLPSDFGIGDDEKALDAVLDRLQLDRFLLLGLSGVGHVAVRYAAAHPERAEALILIGTTVTGVMPSYNRGVAAENWEFFLRSHAPTSVAPEEARLWFDSLNESTLYDDWQIRSRMFVEDNIEEDLQLLRVPTLVIHQRAVSSSEGARKLAALIPGARLVMINGLRMLGDDATEGDAAEGIAAIEAFLSEIFPDAPQTVTGASARLEGLSPREIEVLRLVAAGRSNQQIANELVISVRTAERHIANIYLKTGVANRTEASLYARDHGLG